MNVFYNLTGRYFNALADAKTPKPQNCEVPHSPKNKPAGPHTSHMIH